MIRKLLLLFFVITTIRIASSCCECDESLSYFDFNKLTLANIDNTGDWPVSTASDSMWFEAVAFEAALFDSTGYYYAMAKPSHDLHLGFQAAYSCKCSFPVQSMQQMSEINIYTLESLNDSLPAGANVSRLFVAQSTSGGSNSTLYVSLPDLCNSSEQQRYYYGEGVESFRLFLKIPVSSPFVRFEMVIKLTDDRELTSQTRRIYIRHQQTSPL